MSETRLHIAGRAAYGSGWNTMRRALVFETTHGRTTHSPAMTAGQRRRLTERVERHATQPMWPQSPSSMHLWADRERERAETASAS